jgi:hypothetical protein
MQATEVLMWLKHGYSDATRVLGEDEETWWPGSQSEATTWMWATILRAARSLVDYRAPTEFWASLHGEAQRSEREQLVKDWQAEGATRAFYDGHDLLDFSFKHYTVAYPNCLGAESEMAPVYGVGDSLTRADDYSWDFFKLLQVTVPNRLFFARVGRGWDGVAGADRRPALAETLKRISTKYAPQFIRQGDGVGLVVLPSERTQWEDVRVIVANAPADGKLEWSELVHGWGEW